CRRTLRIVATLFWYAAVALPVRPPWKRARRGQGWHHRAACLLVPLVVAGTMASGTAALTTTWILVRTLPVSLAAVGWGLANGGHLTVRDNLVIVAGMSRGASKATTVGDVVLTKDPPGRLTTPVLRHEGRHRDQWAALGPVLFPAAYATSSA